MPSTKIDPDDIVVRPFADWLLEQSNGNTHDELGEALHDLIARVTDTGKRGSLSLTVTVAPMKDDLEILVVTDEIKLKLPEHDRKPSIFYPGEHGNLSRKDPEPADVRLAARGPGRRRPEDRRDSGGSGMSTTAERFDLLPFAQLAKGAHDNPADGVCLLEAVAWVSGEKHSDHPTCASPILGTFGRSLNDVLPDDKRQRLVALVPSIVGTAGDGLDQQRGLMAADWIVHTYVPSWLRVAGLTADAAALEAAPEVTSWDELVAVTPLLVKSKKSAAAARAAARAAAWDAAWAAAGDAAWDAAGDAAGDALQPSVDALQDSAIELYTRMCQIGDNQ